MTTLPPSNERFLALLASRPASERAALVAARERRDVAFFARLRLPHHCRLPFAPFHHDLFRWHLAGGEPASRRGRRLALAAPRGSAKSTFVSLVMQLHNAAFDRERFVVIVSATERQAGLRLRALRAEVERGVLGRAVRAGRANARELEVGTTRFAAFGAGSEMRGIAREAWRPTAIVLDDAEHSRAAASPRAREALVAWFGEVVEHLGDRHTDILAIGTVLHERGLLAHLLARPDFSSMRLRSIISHADDPAPWAEWRGILLDRSRPDPRGEARAFFLGRRVAMAAGTQVLWPEREDYEELMAQLALQGRHAFSREKQNAPLGPEDALFDPGAALRGVWRAGDLDIASGPGGTVRTIPGAGAGQRFGHLDPAMGGAGGDFAALATVLACPDGTLLLEGLWARRASPSEQVRRLFDAHESAPFTRLSIEGTGAQELLLVPIAHERDARRAVGRRHDLPVDVVRPRTRKEARIAALEPLLANGSLVLGGALDEEFWEELGAYPRSAHDDALDAVAGAVELARGHLARALGAGPVPAATVPPRRRAGY